VSVLERHLVQGNNPCMNWNVSNAMIEQDAAGNRKFSKQSSRFRIDGVVSLAMAIGLKSRDLSEVVESVYKGMTQAEITARMAF
jgi:phage terminase large subunit-like protein